MKAINGINLQQIAEFKPEKLAEISRILMENYKLRLNHAHGSRTECTKSLQDLYHHLLKCESLSSKIKFHMDNFINLSRLAVEAKQAKSDAELDLILAHALQHLAQQPRHKLLSEDNLYFWIVQRDLAFEKVDTSNIDQMLNFVQNYREELVYDDTKNKSWQSEVQQIISKAISLNYRQMYDNLKLIENSALAQTGNDLSYFLSLQIKTYIDLILYITKKKHNSHTLSFCRSIQTELEHSTNELERMLNKYTARLSYAKKNPPCCTFSCFPHKQKLTGIELRESVQERLARM